MTYPPTCRALACLITLLASLVHSYERLHATSTTGLVQAAAALEVICALYISAWFLVLAFAELSGVAVDKNVSPSALNTIVGWNVLNFAIILATGARVQLWAVALITVLLPCAAALIWAVFVDYLPQVADVAATLVRAKATLPATALATALLVRILFVTAPTSFALFFLGSVSYFVARDGALGNATIVLVQTSLERARVALGIAVD